MLGLGRNFPENGIKLLLHEPLNVRDLLAIGHSPLAADIDYRRLAPDPTSYVQRDYRHVESDLVLRGPLRQPGRRSRLTLWPYSHLEHQSEPDRFVPLVRGSARHSRLSEHPAAWAAGSPKKRAPP
jgi:hypothetical protein